MTCQGDTCPSPPTVHLVIRVPAACSAALLLLLGSGPLTGCQAVLFRSLNASARKTGIVVQHDVVYDRTHQLVPDVDRPRDAHDAPVVVFF